MPTFDQDQPSTTSDHFTESFFDALEYQQDTISTPAADSIPTESQAFESAIRKLVDQEGVVGSDIIPCRDDCATTDQRRKSLENQDDAFPGAERRPKTGATESENDSEAR